MIEREGKERKSAKTGKRNKDKYRKAQNIVHQER
jgi:hypothetical protein